MAIEHRIRPKYPTKNDQIVAEIIVQAGARPPLDPFVVVKRKSAEVAAAMALLHGGDWRVVVDHENRMVLVRPV